MPIQFAPLHASGASSSTAARSGPSATWLAFVEKCSSGNGLWPFHTSWRRGHLAQRVDHVIHSLGWHLARSHESIGIQPPRLSQHSQRQVPHARGRSLVSDATGNPKPRRTWATFSPVLAVSSSKTGHAAASSAPTSPPSRDPARSGRVSLPHTTRTRPGAPTSSLSGQGAPRPRHRRPLARAPPPGAQR